MVFSMLSAIKTSPIIKRSNNFINAKKGKQVLKGLCYIPEDFMQKDKAGNYEDFMEKFKKFYPDMSLKQFILFIQYNANKIGEGRSSEAFEIPQIDDYIIKMDKELAINIFTPVKPLKKVPQEFYGFNFGQPVADNGKGISVHMKVPGKAYGLNNWISYYSRLKCPERQEVNDFIYNDLAQLSEFPQTAFDDFVKRISFVLAKTKSFFDFYNPNNFIIDFKNKRINVVDVSSKNEPRFSDYNTMVNAFCDREFLYWGSDKALEDSDKFIKKIVEKCSKASNKYSSCFTKTE